MKINLIDVGSNGTMPSEFKHLNKHLNKILCFDPKYKENTINGNKKFINKAIWNIKTKIPLYYTAGGGLDSKKQNIKFFNENFQHDKAKLNLLII